MKDHWASYRKAMRKDDFKKALKILQKMWKAGHRDAVIMGSFSETTYELRQYKKALKWAQKARKEAPESGWLKWTEAGALYGLDRLEEAIKLWKSIVNMGIDGFLENSSRPEIDAKWAESFIVDCHYRIGDAYYYLNKEKKALTYIDTHLKMRKRKLDSIYSKKEVMRKKRMVITELEQKPYLDAYYRHLQKGKWSKALKALKILYKTDPSGPWIASALGSAYYELEDYSTALQWHALAYEEAPLSANVLWNYAGTLYSLGGESEAIGMWRSIIEMGVPGIMEHTWELETTPLWAKSLIVDSYYRIGQAYFYLDEDDKALEYIDAHLKRREGMDSHFSKKHVMWFKKVLTKDLS